MTTTMTSRRQDETKSSPSGAATRLKVDARVAGALPVASTALWQGGGRAPIAWAVSAHGGAGATTLAQMLAPVGDAADQWPAHDEYPLCVVVCRSTRTGLDAAQSAILQSKSGHTGRCEVLGVVIVADAPGKTPKSLAQRETVLEELTTVWRVPYLTGIRENDVGDLAEWKPHRGSESDDGSKRTRRRKSPVTEEVPAAVAAVGEEIFNAAFAVHQQAEKGNTP
ncbi:DUF6668 family protein [Corynebacterium senegalense]|uniref:DUF6668 family protein n=1 Tax=Corynebacterium senegalense TaxID=2080750 RepID=UPI0011C04DC5|nr:DUF6668 family protein [Corynebacterium senegalense]